MTPSLPPLPPLPSIAALLALPGSCRGALLSTWATRLHARHGAAALRAVRAAVGPALATAGDDPRATARLPIGLPLALHVAVAQEVFGGDAERLRDDLVADGLGQLPRVARVGLRAAGVARVVRGANALHRALYDRGEVRVVPAGAAAPPTLTVHGGGLFAQPLWQAEQRWALDALMELCGEAPGWTAAEDDDGVVWLRPPRPR